MWFTPKIEMLRIQVSRKPFYNIFPVFINISYICFVIQCVHVFLSRIFAARSRLFDQFFKKLIWQFFLSILEWFSPKFSWRSDVWVRRGAPHTKTVVFHQILIIYWWIKNHLSCIFRYDLPVFQHKISFDYFLRECKLYLFYLSFALQTI